MKFAKINEKQTLHTGTHAVYFYLYHLIFFVPNFMVDSIS